MKKSLTVAQRTTQYDIARALGVSQSTVSQVLGNRTGANIPEETRQRVLEAARTLGYVPDRIARSLRTGKTGIIAAVIPDITNPFYPGLVRSIQDVAEAHEYHVATYNTDGDEQKERQMLDVVMQARVDGLIMAPFHLNVETLQPLLQRNIPIVLMSVPGQYDQLGVDSIGTEPVELGKAATEYLIGRGHRRIAMLVSSLAEAGVRRATGYRQALLEHGLEAGDELLIWCQDFSEQSGYEGMQQCAQLRPLPGAILAASDQLALGALQATRDLGLLCPREIALMGIDDILQARLVTPALTTVAQHQKEQGRLAAQMLFDRITQQYMGPARNVCVPFEIIVRESA